MTNRFVLPALCVMIVIALAAVSAFGIVGVGRSGVFNFDGQVLYAAGRAWLQGANPYDYAALVQANSAVAGLDLTGLRFFYPPQASSFCIALGLLPYAAARHAWLLVNLAAIAATVWTAALTVREETPDKWQVGAGLLAAVIIGNPFTAHVVWMGQTTLVAFAATFAAWHLARDGRWLLAGMCLGLASYKPQICILVVLWLFLDRNWRVLLTAGTTAGLLALYPVITQGPVGTLLAWRTAISSGYDLEPNLPGFPHKVGLASLFDAAGVYVPGTILVAAGVLATLVLWLGRRRMTDNDVLGLLMAITATFFSFLHDYDYVVLVPIYISLWRLAPMSRAAIFGSLFLVLALFLPQRLVHLIAIAGINQWRTVVVAALACGIVYLAGRENRGARGFSPNPVPP